MTKLTVPDWILDNFIRLFLKKAKLPKTPLASELRGSYLPKETQEEKAQFIYKAPLAAILGKEHFSAVLQFWNYHFAHRSQFSGVPAVSPEKWFYTIYATVARGDKMVFDFTVALESFPELTNAPEAPRYKDCSLALFEYSKTIETLPQAHCAILQCLSECLVYTEKSFLGYAIAEESLPEILDTTPER